jgi:polynucleotide 5'-kinase involved in rRNA processing
VRDLLRQFPVVALLGARLVGKTTLARTIAAAQRGPVSIFDLDVGPGPPIRSSPSAGYADS